MSIARLGRASLFTGLVAIALLCRADVTPAQEAFVPTVLTEQRMAGYVAALPEIAALKAAMPAATETFSVEYWTALADIAKKHGFVEFDDFVALQATVAVTLTGFDPLTRAFTEPRILLEDRIAFLTQFIARMTKLASVRPTANPADASARIAHFTQALDELKEARTTLPAKTDPRNVKLVGEYFDKLVLTARGQ